ncbi:hypothetical protein ACP70R_004082 [Stipagrostis hirtigluma subsp. patula]
MSSFCKWVNTNGVVHLKLAGDDSHHYLTKDAIDDLRRGLTEIRQLASSEPCRGLITTSSIGSFCDGIDHESTSAKDAADLAERMTDVIRLLLEMPVPTVAAVGGDAMSLGLALALAHDHCVVLEDAALGLPEARHGRPLPGYVPALLRDKVAYARLRKLLLLKSQVCTGKELAGTWWSAHAAANYRHKVLTSALEVLEGIKVGDGTDYAKVRKTLWPGSCGSVNIETPLSWPRASADEEQSDKQQVARTAMGYPVESYDVQYKAPKK